MKAFWRKAVLAGGMAAFVASTAQAVELNPNGLGQVLIYPYYTARSNKDGNAYNTLLSVVNHTHETKAVKIRLREGRHGEEVASFNLFLSKQDVWTAALAPDEGGLKIVTGDTSCISPAIGSSGTVLSLSGDPADRVLEGYIEVIEMGSIVRESPTDLAVTHINGTPKACAAGFKAPTADIGANSGGLSGHLTLIDVQAGVSFNIRATALDKFAKAGTALGYTAPGEAKPDLTSADPVSIVPGTGDVRLLISQWEAGTADAVSAVLMHASIANEYVLESSTGSETNWTVTFPTKHYYYEKTPTESANKSVFKVLKLFQNDFDREKMEACDDGFSSVYDRESYRYFYSCGWGVCPPVETTPKSCHAVNLISFFSSWDDRRRPASAKWSSGHVEFVFSAPENSGTHRLFNSNTVVIRKDGSSLAGQARTYYGLPAMGFSAYTYTNGTIALPDGKVGRSIYGVTEPHSYQTRIE